jgi:hypothetical protein
MPIELLSKDVIVCNQADLLIRILTKEKGRESAG